MRKQIKDLATLLLLAATWTGCTDEIIIEKTATDTAKGTILIASMGENTPQTRVDFTDNGTYGIDLKWSAKDDFSVFEKSSGDKVGDFRLKSGAGSKQGLFEALGTVTLTEGTEYIAIYPAASGNSLSPTIGSIQNGTNDMTQLNDMLCMTTEFTHNGSEILAFNHQYAMLTIKLPAGTVPDAPLKVSMHSSLNDFSEVQFTYANQTSEITAYTMMQPATGTRDLSFTVLTSTGKVYTKTVSTDKEYKAGKRYTATLDNLTEVTGVTLASFASGTPNGDVWVITDSGAPEQSKFDNLKSQVDAIQNADRKIELIFPAIVTVTERALYAGPLNLISLKSVSFPQATTIGNNAFYRTNIQSICLPKVKALNKALGSSSIISAYLPELTEVADNEFQYCIHLNTVNLPNITKIGNSAFLFCLNLKSVSIATQAILTSLGTDIFSNTPTANITLNTHSVNGSVADNKWTFNGTEIGQFKKIRQFK